mmetsp:Transcript_32465/g.82472  ORF Transcript_32465/g.82472 Transcript_32465/m.82472 type:complete len:203 (+) Transcript_32465:1093-1701(+)
MAWELIRVEALLHRAQFQQPVQLLQRRGVDVGVALAVHTRQYALIQRELRPFWVQDGCAQVRAGEVAACAQEHHQRHDDVVAQLLHERLIWLVHRVLLGCACKGVQPVPPRLDDGALQAAHEVHAAGLLLGAHVHHALQQDVARARAQHLPVAPAQRRKRHQGARAHHAELGHAPLLRPAPRICGHVPALVVCYEPNQHLGD